MSTQIVSVMTAAAGIPSLVTLHCGLEHFEHCHAGILCQTPHGWSTCTCGLYRLVWLTCLPSCPGHTRGQRWWRRALGWWYRERKHHGYC